MKKIIVISGPTAVGKTSLSIELSKSLNGEIVSADSMQVYKGLDIGTAKPTYSERQGIPHHMLDVCSPDHRYSVAEYTQDAVRAIDDIHSRGKLPIVVGGTGLYIDHLLYITDFQEGESDPMLREKLTSRAIVEGGAVLKKELSEFDPETASRLHDNDIKRIVRAIEFYSVTGKTISEHNKENSFVKKRYDADFYVLNCDRKELYDRINLRVDKMMEDGLIKEAERVCSAVWFADSTASQAIGYKEFLPYFNSSASLDYCVELLKQHSRNYAKRQLTWFRAKSDAIFLDVLSDALPIDFIISSFRKDK
jgi:tRNA dimethylallyltransferase